MEHVLSAKKIERHEDIAEEPVPAPSPEAAAAVWVVDVRSGRVVRQQEINSPEAEPRRPELPLVAAGRQP